MASKDYEFDLDILGQQPGLHLYTQLCFCFANSSSVPDDRITDILTTGLESLCRIAPWIAGEIVKNGSGPENSGTYSIGKIQSHPALVIEDHRKLSQPSFAQLKQRAFPASELREDLYASKPTIPPSSNGFIPVVEIKVNLIDGGLILTIVGHHQAMDMMGQAYLIRLLSKACARQTITDNELQILNTARANSIPLLEKEHVSQEDGNLQKTSPWSQDQIQGPPTTAAPEASIQQPSATCSWAFFNFSHSALAMIKNNAIASITTGYVSTDDALTAFVWKSLSKARACRTAPNTITKFGRAVDVRRYLGWPKTYPGLMQNMSHHSRTITQIASEPLGSIASELRIAVDPTTTKLAQDTRILATKIAYSKDRTKFNFTGDFDPSTGLMFSSWAGVECYDLEFGLGLGPPEMVRRPSFINVEGLAYLMPKHSNGDIALMLCARDQDLAQLRLDHDFMNYATYIG